MPISLNFTTIDDCTATGGFVAPSAPIGGFATESDIPNKQGANGIEFHHTGGGGAGEIRRNFSPAIDVRDNEIGFWFLNAYQNQGGTRLFDPLSFNANQIAVRLYSGSNAVEYYQDQFVDFNGDWLGGWLFCRASGVGNEDAVISGTWGATQAAAVDGVSLILRQNATNGGNNDAEHCIDWIHYWDKIIVTGYADEPTNTQPWRMADIFAKAQENISTNPDGEWGQVENTENFYKLFAGLEIGDGSTTTEFEADNEYIFFAASSEDLDYDVTIRAGATVTLGVKDVGNDGTYAQNGVQMVVAENAVWPKNTSPLKPRPNLTVQSGTVDAVFNTFATLIRGFNVINLGQNGAGTIEGIGADFFDNTTLELRSTGLDWLNVRCHFPDGSEGDLGTVFSLPAGFDGVRAFQCLDAFEFRVTATIDNFFAGDNTRDLLVLEGTTLTAINSSFNNTKLERTT